MTSLGHGQVGLSGCLALMHLPALGAAQEEHSPEAPSPFASTSASSRSTGDLGRVGGATLEDACPNSKAFLRFDKSWVTTRGLSWLVGGEQEMAWRVPDWKGNCLLL